MINLTNYLFDYADAEFNGKSFNGPPLMTTLRSISASAAANTATYEGFCAWEVAYHLAYYKYFIVRSLGLAADLEPYPFGGEDWTGPPVDKSDEAWKRDLDYLEKAHAVAMRILKNLPAERLEEIMPEWQISYGRAIVWLFGHDTYHTAMIRSMGVLGVRSLRN